VAERDQRLNSIFHSAIEREGVERRAFLDGACAGDEGLRRQVEALIRSHEQADVPAPDPKGTLVGRTLDQYRLFSLVGSGGMGEVYLAEDTRLDRRVAIKVLTSNFTTDAAQVRRFQQEARAASALNHPNIITVYDINESDGTQYIATEFIGVIYSVWSAAEKLQSVWKLSIDGGQPVRLTDYGSHDPSYSPDGKWIGCFYVDRQTNKWDYGIISASEGKPVRQFDFPGFQYQWVRWTPDGRHLSFIGVPPDPSNIWLQPAEGGAPRKLTDFRQDYIFRHAWSRDGKNLAVVRGRPTSDVVLLKDNR